MFKNSCSLVQNQKFKLLNLKFNSIGSARYFSDDKPNKDELKDSDSLLFDDFNRKVSRPILNKNQSKLNRLKPIDHQHDHQYSPLKHNENLSTENLNELKQQFNDQFNNQSNNQSNNRFNNQFNAKRRLSWIETNQNRIKEQTTLENLGLDKYAELYDANKQTFQQDPDEERLNYFEKFLEQRVFKELTVEMYEELIDSDDKREEIKQILRDYELEKYNTSNVPTNLSLNDMKELLNFTKREQEAHFLFLYKREVAKTIRGFKHEVEKVNTHLNLTKKHEASKKRSGLEFNEDGAPFYAKWKNTLFISFNRSMLRKESDRRVRDASLFGPKLVIDFGYPDETIYRRQSFITLTTQMIYLLSEVHHSKIPFHLNLCNLSKERPVYKYLETNLKFMTQKNFLHTITDQSYLDLFPKKDLIYLTSDSNNKLEHVDPDKIYIVGGFCDKHNRGPHSLNKAKSEGIPAFKLPLEDYFFFKLDRVLTMNLVVAILENYLETNDWRKSIIGKVPVRKLKTPDEVYIEQIRQVKKYFSKKKHFKKLNDEEIINYDTRNSPIYNPIYNSSYKNSYSRNEPFENNKSYSKSNYRSRQQDDKRTNYTTNDDRNKV